jgi:hypothetical protein
MVSARAFVDLLLDKNGIEPPDPFEYMESRKLTTINQTSYKDLSNKQMKMYKEIEQ